MHTRIVVLIVISIFFGLTSFSQDRITTIDEEVLYCKITSEDSTDIYFTKKINGAGVETKLAKSKVANIEYDAGFDPKKNRCFCGYYPDRGMINMGIGLSGSYYDDYFDLGIPISGSFDLHLIKGIYLNLETKVSFVPYYEEVYLVSMVHLKKLFPNSFSIYFGLANTVDMTSDANDINISAGLEVCLTKKSSLNLSVFSSTLMYNTGYTYKYSPVELSYRYYLLKK